MLNLAAIKYRNVLAEFGGPIAKIFSTPVSVYGRKTYQANAFLTAGLAPSRPAFEIDSDADGTGSSESPQEARYMAVSEALERWAFHTELAGNNAQRYGFHDDRSSNGMAAFPGVFKSQARQRAHLEALERLALISWWDGRILASPAASPFAGINIVRLHHMANFGEVVVVYRKSRSGHVSYGHAAGKSLSGAATRAVVELARNEFVVTLHKLRGHSKPVRDFFERRCLYFASPDGFKEFLDRISVEPTKPAPAWDPVYDGEIPGPWSRYATVWRTALRMPTQDYLDPKLNFFFW